MKPNEQRRFEFDDQPFATRRPIRLPETPLVDSLRAARQRELARRAAADGGQTAEGGGGADVKPAKAGEMGRHGKSLGQKSAGPDCQRVVFRCRRWPLIADLRKRF